MNEFKDRLRYVRKLRGLSQKELADQIPTSQSTINDLESGKNKTTKYILRISDVLDVDGRWLERGLGSPAGDGITVVNQGSPLPLFTWEQVAINVRQPTVQPTMVDMIHRCPVNHSDKSFCLSVATEHATGCIQAGNTIFVDPVCTYSNGCYVIAMIGDVVMLRQIVSDGVNTFLKTTNETLEPEFRMTAVNVESIAEAEIKVPTQSKSGVNALLIGRVILRMECLL